MIHEKEENVATAGTSCDKLLLAKGQKRKAGEAEQQVAEWKPAVGDDDSESGVSDLESILMMKRKRKKSLPLSSTSALSYERSLGLLISSHEFPVLREEDITSTVTSLEVEDMEHQVGVAFNNAIGDGGGVEWMDYRTADEDDEDDGYETAVRSISTTIVEIDEEDEEEEVISPSKYVLSSGRVIPARQPEKLPTIDDEFEQYFRQLML